MLRADRVLPLCILVALLVAPSVAAAEGRTAEEDPEVEVGAEGFLPLSTPEPAGPEARAAVLTLHRGALVCGRLLDADGKPLDDHRILFRRPPTSPDDPKGKHLDETGTEEDGSFEFRLLTGPCRVLFVTEEGVDREVSLTLDR